MKKNYSKGILAFLVLTITMNISAQNSSKFWTKIAKSSVTNSSKVQNDYPNNGEIYTLNVNALRSNLVNAPVRGIISETSSVVIDFPVLNGKTERFRIMEAPVMHPTLSAKYPDIKSYVGN